MIHAQTQKRPQGWGDVVIDVFIGGFGTMALKSLWFIFKHPMLWVPSALIGGFVYLVGPYPTLVILGIMAFMIHTWWTLFPDSFDRYLGHPTYVACRRTWTYQIKWRATMIDCGLLKSVRLRIDRVPKIKCLETNQYRDRLLIEMVRGQTIDDIERAGPKLLHAFNALEVRIKEESGLRVWLIFRYADPLIETIPAIPIKEDVNIEAVELGITDEGDKWTIPMVHQQGSHMLVAATTGGGKSSIPWGLIRALCPLIRDGLVQVWIADPKGGVEFKRGTNDDETKSLWHRYADDYVTINEMLKDLVVEMDARARRQANAGRSHIMTKEEPLIVVIIDEILSITALESSTRRNATQALLGKLLTKGRALGINIMACSQDATKAMLSTRQFFRLRWAGRLDEPLQVDMVLGEGARKMGAKCDDNKVIPHSLPGVGFIKIDGVREPVRVRAAYVTEEDIREMVETYSPPTAVIAKKKTTTTTNTPVAVSGPIVPPPEQLDEVESWMRFYEKQVSAKTIEDVIEIAEEEESLC